MSETKENAKIESATIKADCNYTITGAEIQEINGLIGNELPLRCAATADRIMGVIVRAVKRMEAANGNADQ